MDRPRPFWASSLAQEEEEEEKKEEFFSMEEMRNLEMVMMTMAKNNNEAPIWKEISFTSIMWNEMKWNTLL